MKKFIRNLALIATVAIGATSCDKEIIIVEEEENNDDVVVLYASTNGASQSRVAFAEVLNDDETAYDIDLLWEEGDVFTLYDATQKVGDFTCTSVDDEGVGTFSATGVTFTGGTTYTAIYPKSDKETLTGALAADLTSYQDGNLIGDLDNACMMKASFTYSEGSDISMEFAHLKAVMTFTFATDSRLSKLIFKNGNDSYTVDCSGIATANGYYTSYIMIEPCEATSRTLKFSLYDSDDTAYDVRSVSSSKAYEAGVRYTSPVSELTPEDEIDADIVYNSTDKVYEIYSALGLQAFANLVNATGSNPGAICVGSTSEFAFTTETKRNIDGKLKNNISLSEVCSSEMGSSWTPIGDNSGHKYSGTFDGGGYLVSDLYINIDKSQEALFGFTDTEGIICNLGVSGTVTVASDALCHETSGLIAYNSGYIINCYNLATIIGELNIGGIAGYNDGYIFNSYNQGKVTGTEGTSTTDGEVTTEGRNVGGICGQSKGGYMANCYSTGEITGEGNVGGVLGYLFKSSDTNFVATTVEDCYCLEENNAYSIGSTNQTANTFTANSMMSDNFINGNKVTFEGDSNFEGLNVVAAAYNTSSEYFNTIYASSWKIETSYPILTFENAE
ncbi:MAG: hypothetical protein R3Y22_06075 [Bacteroidales bacterium]